MTTTVTDAARRITDRRIIVQPDAEITPAVVPVKPSRIQRRRTAGWRMPAGTVYVGRPSRWGNPFPGSYFGPAEAVRLYREWLAGADHLGSADAGPRRQRALDGLADLTGRNLACWCPIGQPCHADVLLTLANPTAAPQPTIERTAAR